jgi:hypothetical protein
MEKTVKKRTREEVRAAFRETMRRKKQWLDESSKQIELLNQQGFFNY